MSLDLQADLEFRNLVYQTTDPSIWKELSTPAVLYTGIDPTADSLHIGSLLPVLTLRRFQLAGHSPIALIGGATAMIGDPSGKSSERNLLDQETIQKNIASLKRMLEQLLEFDGKRSVKVQNNADWISKLSFIDFLRDTGKHFTINHMVAKDSVKNRMESEQGISYTEFSYMLLQAYDFLYLHQKEKCRLQIGGSDQWGNITAGCELIRRKANSKQNVFGMTFPLITKADGTKYGKSEKGNIWLDAKKTSPYEFYQFLLRAEDTDVVKLLKFFTFLSHKEIQELEKMVSKNPEKREAQKILAAELTTLVHGKDELSKVQNASQALFGEEIKTLDAQTLRSTLSDAPSTQKKKSDIDSGLSLIDLLVETKLCSSKGAARKDVQSGGVYINNVRQTDIQTRIVANDLISGEILVLRKGKKNYHLVSFS